MKEKALYKLSVILPVRDIEKYITESLETVIADPMWRKHAIEIIIINDGSEDTTGDVCLRYRDRFPDHIRYILHENPLGISSSRNEGMKLAKGEYITFLDGDDYWESGSLSTLCSYLDANAEEVDCVFGAMKHVEGRNTYALQKTLRDKKKIVELQEEPELVQFRINHAVIKTQVAQQVSFTEGLGRCDILYYVTRILMQKKKYGINPAAQYYYRIRFDNSNYSMNRKIEQHYFTTDITVAMREFMEEMREPDGTLSPYIQNVVLREIRDRLRNKNQIAVLDEKEYLTYKSSLSSILQEIDDERILFLENLVIERKLYVLRLKHGDAIDQELHYKDRQLYFKDISFYNFQKKPFTIIARIEIVGDTIVLEGRSGVPGLTPGSYELFFTDSRGNHYPMENFTKYDRSITCLGEEVKFFRGFRVTIPIAHGMEIKGYLKIGEDIVQIGFRFGQNSRLSRRYRRSYYRKGDITLYTKKNTLLIDKTHSRFYFESRYIKDLVKAKRWKDIAMRQRAFRCRKAKKNKVWLFVDRVDSADENAEFLFQYVNKHKPEGVDLYYILDEKSEDFERMKSIGNVVPYGSDKFLNLYFAADEYITSQTTGFIRIPTSLGGYKCINDLVPDRTLYLQHGVLEKDVSDGQNQLKQNLRMFVTSSPAEYQSMLDYPYGYTEREVKLTGLARHDQLMDYMDKHGKVITIAPTWRRNLSTRIDAVHGGRGYYPYFKESDFFHFYNSLINDKRILEAMKEGGYRGVFRPHPYMRVQVVDFEFGDMFTVADEKMRYVDQFQDCGLLITDYSSIATEYAYIGCPVIYTQFDIDTFYENHTYSAGFFEYERDGFGPVCYDYESTVAEILKALKSGCVMEEKYQERRRNFFAFFDGRNCERIYNEILEISKEE